MITTAIQLWGTRLLNTTTDATPLPHDSSWPELLVLLERSLADDAGSASSLGTLGAVLQEIAIHEPGLLLEVALHPAISTTALHTLMGALVQVPTDYEEAVVDCALTHSQHSAAVIRERCLDLLLCFPRPRSRPALRQAVADPVLVVRRRAVNGMISNGLFRHRDTVASLQQLCSDPGVATEFPLLIAEASTLIRLIQAEYPVRRWNASPRPAVIGSGSMAL